MVSFLKIYKPIEKKYTYVILSVCAHTCDCVCGSLGAEKRAGSP